MLTPDRFGRVAVSGEGLETTVETGVETVSEPISASEQSVPTISTPRLRPTPFRCRLPRFIRAKRSRRPSIALQDRDLELLRTVFEYRLISTHQVLRLFSDESRDGIYRRLQKLFHQGYLDRLGTNPNAPLVYSLAPRGGEVLGVSARSEPGNRYVAHQLMISDFRISLVQGAKPRSIEILWRAVPRGLPVQPDGFFGLRFPDRPEGANRSFFCLEADRSTMPRARFLEKLHRYQSWQAAGGHTAALGIKSFRVLAVTKSRERVTSLLSAASTDSRLAVLRPACWLASQAEVCNSLETVFGPIWRSAAEPSRPQSLLPPVGR